MSDQDGFERGRFPSDFSLRNQQITATIFLTVIPKGQIQSAAFSFTILPRKTMILPAYKGSFCTQRE
jgi:hypothetical protein